MNSVAKLQHFVTLRRFTSDSKGQWPGLTWKWRRVHNIRHEWGVSHDKFHLYRKPLRRNREKPVWGGGGSFMLPLVQRGQINVQFCLLTTISNTLVLLYGFRGVQYLSSNSLCIHAYSLHRISCFSAKTVVHNTAQCVVHNDGETKRPNPGAELDSSDRLGRFQVDVYDVQWHEDKW